MPCVMPSAMPTLTLLSSLLIEGRIVVGLAAAAITLWTATILGCPAELPLLATVCAATIIIYDLDRWIDRRGSAGAVPFSVAATFVLAVLLLAVTVPLLERVTNLALLFGLPLCALYCVPAPRWFPLRSIAGQRPKDHPIGKALFVASAVTTATVLLPLFEANVLAPHLRLETGRLFLVAGWVFIAILSNALACDLRDHPTDLAARLRTVPTVLGAGRTRSILLATNVTIFVATLVMVSLGALPAATLLPLAIASIGLLLLSERNSTRVWTFTLDGAFLPLLFVAL